MTELARIAAALAASGTPVALLKGAATGRTVYGSPAARLVNDLDLLVPAADVETARAAVAALGYAAHGPLGSGRFGRWQRRYRCELQMVCAHPDRRGLLVELHWSLVELPYYVERIPMAEVWATTRPAEGLPGAVHAGPGDPAPAQLRARQPAPQPRPAPHLAGGCGSPGTVGRRSTGTR